MSVKIYEMAHSPYCIPITQALTALGVPFERVPVSNWDRSAIIRLTKGAYYQVPVLVHDDRVVHESGDASLDVATYVDQTFANGRLFPGQHHAAQTVLVEHIENEVEGLTFKLCDIYYLPSIEDLVERTMVIRHKERRFGRGCVDAWKAAEADLKAHVEVLFGRFDTTLQHTSFLLDDNMPCYVDYALSGVIGNYTHGGHHQLSSKHAALQAWHERLLAFRFSA